MTTPDESRILYTLFCLHILGKRLVLHACPNCGDIPHIEEKRDGQTIYTCVQCKCVSSNHDKETHE